MFFIKKIQSRKKCKKFVKDLMDLRLEQTADYDTFNLFHVKLAELAQIYMEMDKGTADTVITKALKESEKNILMNHLKDIHNDYIIYVNNLHSLYVSILENKELDLKTKQIALKHAKYSLSISETTTLVIKSFERLMAL